MSEPKLRTGEQLDRNPEEVCLCGHARTMHRIDTKKMAREQGDCDGFTLHHYRWRITRWADTMPSEVS